MSSAGETAVDRQAGLALRGLHARRMWKDRLFRWAMAAGGISVIIALLLIFVYLLYVVAPIFDGAHVDEPSEVALPAGAGGTRHIALDEYAEVMLRVSGDGEYTFLRTAGLDVIEQQRFPGLEPGAPLSFAAGEPGTGMLALASADGVVLARTEYSVSYPDDQRLVTPAMSYPFGEAPVEVAGGGLPQAMAVQSLDGEAVLVTLEQDGRLLATASGVFKKLKERT